MASQLRIAFVTYLLLLILMEDAELVLGGKRNSQRIKELEARMNSLNETLSCKPFSIIKEFGEIAELTERLDKIEQEIAEMKKSPEQVDDCFTKPVGISDQAKIPDNQMSASSRYGDSSKPAYGRLNGDRGDGWCAESARNDDWLQVDLSATYQVCGTATQGDRNGNEWVTDFNMSYSSDGNVWTPYMDANGVEVEFHREGDSNTVDQHNLSVPVSARYFRFRPTKQHTWNCLRVELYGTKLCKFDFEDGMASWNKTGTAFDNQPTYGDNSATRTNGQQPANQQGDYWIGGYENRPSPSDQAGAIQGDIPKGTLTSPFFDIRGKNITFMIGGGCNINLVRVELVVGVQVVRTATGKCTETMHRETWDVIEFYGERAQVRLVDNSSGGWGHINFDDLKGDITCGHN